MLNDLMLLFCFVVLYAFIRPLPSLVAFYDSKISLRLNQALRVIGHVVILKEGHGAWPMSVCTSVSVSMDLYSL